MGLCAGLCGTVVSVANASWSGHGGTCPYLRKVVPEGDDRIKAIKYLLEMQTTDCSAFSREFKENGTFTAICGRSGNTHQMTSQGEVQNMCKMYPLLGAELKGVFPDFSTSDLLFEVESSFQHQDQVERLVDGGEVHKVRSLWQTHSCNRIKKITRAKIINGEASNVPEAMHRAGEHFLTQFLEKGDCAVFADLVENDMSMEFHGEPHQVIKGGMASFESALAARSACVEKTKREAHIHTSMKVTIQGRYYDNSQNELTLLAQREGTTVFRPGAVFKKPVAVVLRFSKEGKIQAVNLYETEVLSLDQKWGQTYGKQVVSAGNTDTQLGSSKATGDATQESLLKLSPGVQAKKCEWLAAKELSGGCTWLKAQPWYAELTNMCIEHEQKQIKLLSAEAKAKKCEWLNQEKRLGKFPETQKLTSVRALAAMCVDSLPPFEQVLTATSATVWSSGSWAEWLLVALGLGLVGV